MFKAGFLAALLCALPAFAADEAPPGTTMQDAFAQAALRKSAVLVDFHAPWCYSCYYMAKHVLTGPEWQKVERETVVVALDADAPEGAYWKDRLKVKALPSYVLLDAQGEEIGRILGEQTRQDFYRQLAGFHSRGDPLSKVQEKVRGTDAASLAAARTVLASYRARYDAEGGLAWARALSADQRKALEADRAARLELQRLELLKAHQQKETTACLDTGELVLAGELGCERPYELDKVLSCAADLPAEEKFKRLRGQKPAMEKLLDRGVFGKQPCADERSAVLAAADLYEALDGGAAVDSVLTRAIAKTRAALGGNPKQDRNLADNLRVYLDRAGRTAELDDWLQKLIAAYPDDYVYSNRYARSLAGRGKHAEAIPHFERAATLAYGVNRLRNAEQHALSLKAMGRPDDALRVIAEALKANGPWFPEEVAKLKSLQAELRAAATG